MNFKGNKNIGSSSTAKLLTSKGRIEVRRIDLLSYGLMLNQIHRILSMIIIDRSMVIIGQA